MNIGPILGIMSTPRANPGLFANCQSESFAEIINIAERMNCVCFVFNPLDIDWSKNAVWGYQYSCKVIPGEWERRLFPLPSVIYNRIPNRTLENRQDIKNTVLHLKEKYRSRFFNPFFLDKLLTHTILCSNEQIKTFLPKTLKLQHPDTITKMLHLFNSVYLKPAASSLGSEIARITKNNNRYDFIYQSLNHIRRDGSVTDCSKIMSELPLPVNTQEYLVQQAINLAEFNGRPFDLRLLMQKNRYGKWQKTGLAARIAGEGSISTHLFYGGSRSPAEKIIKQAAAYYQFSFAEVKKQLDKIQSLIPRTIEKAYRESFGELEMDIGIDRLGKVWFLEANSKPFRFDEELIRAKSSVRLIHYVCYLDAQIFVRPDHKSSFNPRG